MKIERVCDIPELARSSGRKWVLCAAAPHDPYTVEAIVTAHNLGFARLIAVGNRSEMENAAREAGVEFPTDFRVVETSDDHETAHTCADLLSRNEADVLVKGLISTSTMMRVVMHSESGSPEGGFVSHVSVYNEPGSGRLMFLTDAAINIAPNVYRKVEIVRNAVRVARALGIERPKVAMLAAVEELKYPSMPATLDAVLVSKIASSGVIPDAVVEGPFGLDNAISPAAAELKHLAGRSVAGHADILVMPELVSANIFYKALQAYCGVTFAGVVVGTCKPIALTSRADPAAIKLASLSLACLLAGESC
jgi:phosphate butyryltransferase